MASLPKYDHVVVLMLENRSFDNIAGWLYDPLNDPPFHQVPRNQPFEGLSGKSVSNPMPKGYQPVSVATAGRATTPISPPIDPGETYQHVTRQLYGRRYPCREGEPTMRGFVRDYYRTIARFPPFCLPRPPLSTVCSVMDGFTPRQLPVLSHLAYHYAICDYWFASVPSQTWTNRSFLNAATACGRVNNRPYVQWVGHNADTIFNRIQEANDPQLTWRVYYSSEDLLPLTLLIHFRKLWPFWNTHFSRMEQFYRDAAEGALPSYCVIEPDYVGPLQNDQHPPASVVPAEQLVWNVYRALKDGKKWERTLLIITYDEHGGCFDHVPPPVAVPPIKGAPRGQCGFRFDRLGVRVPAILVSPYIQPGTVFRARDDDGNIVALDHTAVIKTVTNRWELESLTERDRASASLEQVLTLNIPRMDDPTIPVPAGDACVELKYGSHSQSIHKDAHALANAHLWQLPNDASERRHILKRMRKMKDI